MKIEESDKELSETGKNDKSSSKKSLTVSKQASSNTTGKQSRNKVTRIVTDSEAGDDHSQSASV